MQSTQTQHSGLRERKWGLAHVTRQSAPERTKRQDKPERGAETRQQVLDSVVGILNEKGFSALTNSLIIAETGISSGALMHHFPTRQKLLTATVEYTRVELSAFRERQLQLLAPGLPRFRSLIDLAWYTARMPLGLAVNEIRIGVRSDGELSALFRPVFARNVKAYGRLTSGVAQEAGLVANEEVQGLWTATLMSVRSLAIDRKSNPGVDVVAKTLLALRILRESLIAQQLGPTFTQDPKIAWRPAP